MKSRIIKTEEEIQEALISLSSMLNEVYFDKEIELVKMNNAADLFSDDLLDLLEFKFNIQSLSFQSYKSSSYEVEITKDLSKPINNKDVILLDGIIISGNTHHYIANVLNQRKPKSLSIICIGTKKENIKTSLPKTYSLFDFGQEWIEGYGIGDGIYSSKNYLVDLNKS